MKTVERGKNIKRRIQWWSISHFWRIFCCFSKWLTRWRKRGERSCRVTLTHTHTHSKSLDWKLYKQNKKKAHKIQHENNRKSTFFFIYFIPFKSDYRLIWAHSEYWNKKKSKQTHQKKKNTSKWLGKKYTLEMSSTKGWAVLGAFFS